MGVLHAQVDRYAVVINEIMVDPTPMVGLPNAEYIELRNCSKQTIDLQKWKIEKGTSSYLIGTATLLKPDSIIVLCSKSNTGFFSSIRSVAMNSFPALINEEGTLALKSPDNLTIHAVNYQSAWHENAIKASGGWSLEMIDPLKPCEKNNWGSSVHRNGGTPGLENSIYLKTVIQNGFEIRQCVAVNEQTLLLQLENGMDSSSLSNPANYQFNNMLDHIQQVNAAGPLFDEAWIKLKAPIQANTIYAIQIKNILTCKKEKTFEGVVQTGLLKEPTANDILINEILFNPPPDGEDFIELYNQGQAVINVYDLYLSSFNQLGGLNTGYKIGEGYYNLFPGDYAVVTKDTSFVKKQWPKIKSKKMIQIKSIPSMPDDEGNIAIVNKQGKLIDKMLYTEKMHDPFISDPSGVSLERIQFTMSSADPTNWHSASSTSGYGTPTLENSQHNKPLIYAVAFQTTSKIISPNNDGMDDYLTITYQLNQPGYMCSVFLFGLNGNLISKIADNQLLGTKGSIVWNGLHREQMLPSGQYIIYIEAFHLNAKTIKEKILIGIR
jgi:Lamin Tail Domain/CHU_C Type IX secretion signal domain